MDEAKMENVRRFVRAYGELAGYVDRIDDLQHQVLAAFREASTSTATFESVGSILGRHYQKHEQVARKAAWIAQHKLQTRAFAVGNHFVQRQNDVQFSPVVQQLEQLGYQSRGVNFDSFSRLLTDRSWVKRIDALMVRPDAGELVLVKACSFEQLQRQLDEHSSVMTPNLWVPVPQREFCELVPSKFLVSLTYAEWILRSAFPEFDVRSILLVVDPGPVNWRHKGFDVTGTALRHIQAEHHPLSGFDVVWEGEEHDVAYQDIAKIPAADPLNALPVDRAARARMVLEWMWREQAVSDGLAPMTVQEISKSVKKAHLIHYTPDLRRHDLEDCLVTGGYIERPRYEKKCYVLTPLGVFEALVSRQQLAPASGFEHGRDVLAKALGSIRNQARLLARYAEGEQVINKSRS